MAGVKRRGRGKISSDNNDTGKGFCVVCCDHLEDKSVKLSSASRLLGTTPVDAFLKICEVLQVSFLEIQDEWKFEERNTTGEPFPFCRFCISDFLSVVKLQQQLVDIQNKIQDKISSIRNSIVNATETGKDSVLDTKANNFRSKAILNELAGSYKGISEAPVTGSSPTAFSQTTEWQNPIINNNVTHYQQINSYTTLQTPQQHNSVVSNNSSYPSTSAKTELDLNASTLRADYDDQYYDDNDNNNYDDEDADDQLNNEFFDSEDSDDQPKKKKSSNLPVPAHTTEYPIPDGAIVYGPWQPTSTTRKVKKSSKNLSEKKERVAEHFSSMTTDSEGRMFYENIQIIPSTNKHVGYTCGKCGKTVGKAQDTLSLRKTKIHIKGFHLGAYKCSICEKNFTSYDIMSQHITRSHEMEPEPCPICGKPLRLNGNALKDHLYTHMNPSEKETAAHKPNRSCNYDLKYTCRICGKGFYRPGRLRRHEMIHVDAVFRKDFKCTECGKAYTTNQGLYHHIVVNHDNLNARKRLCKVCGETVYFKHFKYHRLLHLEDKGRSIKCKLCGRGFRTRTELKNHEERCAKDMKMREDFDFPCDICNKLFITRRLMLCHRRKVHKSHWKLKVPVKLVKDVSVDNPKEECLDDLNNEGIQFIEGNIYSYLLYELEKLEDGYRCLTCSEEFHEDKLDLKENADCVVEEQVKSHVKFRHSGSFRCNICTKRMISLFEMEAHQRMEHSNLSCLECEICKRTAIPVKTFKRHLWQHKNVWEVADDINAGFRIPDKFICENQVALKEMGVEVNLQCVLCDTPGFDKVEDLYTHRNGAHPKAPIVKATILKNPKKRGAPAKYPEGPQDCPHCGKCIDSRKQLTKHIYKVHGKKKKRPQVRQSSVNKRKSQAATKKKDISEDEQEEEEEEEDMEKMECEVTIKEEALSPENSEEEEEDGCSWSDYEVEKSVEKKRIKRGGDNDVEASGSQRCLRDRGSLRRTIKAVNYAEEQDDGDDDSEN